jgi:hypothetical protein
MGPDFIGKVVESTEVTQGTTKLPLVLLETTPFQRNLSFKGGLLNLAVSVRWAAYLAGEPVQKQAYLT